MIHPALNHPVRGDCQFEAELEKAETENLCERAGYSLKCCLASWREGRKKKKKSPGKGIEKLHCSLVEDRK